MATFVGLSIEKGNRECQVQLHTTLTVVYRVFMALIAYLHGIWIVWHTKRKA